MDSERRLCLMLIGQSELRRLLATVLHEALAHRIVGRYHLNGNCQVILADAVLMHTSVRGASLSEHPSRSSKPQKLAPEGVDDGSP